MNKTWTFPAGLIVVLLISFYLYNRYHVAPKINFNELGLVNLEGEKVKFESFAGKKTVVCFSASWCGNCLQELNDLKAVKEKDLGDVQVIIIDDEPLDQVRVFREKRDYPFIFLKLDKNFKDIGINSIPTSYLLNSRLEVMKETVGYLDWKDASTMNHLKKMMES